MTDPIATLPPGSQTLYDALNRRLSPSVKAWTRQEAARVKAGRGAPMASALNNAIQTRFGIRGRLAQNDIEAIAFFVLMQAAKSAQEDLKAIMEQMRQRSQAKQSVGRVAAVTHNAPPVSKGPGLPPRYVTAASVSASAPATPGALDALAKETQQRLQALMESLSKIAANISAVMKKSSDTSNSIIQNLK